MSTLRLPLRSHDHPGRLLVLSGLQGAGKSTLGRGLVDALAERGVPAVMMKPHTPGFYTYPLFTEFLAASVVGQIGSIDITALTLISLGDTLQQIRTGVVPLLATGTWVILDRYVMDQIAGMVPYPHAPADFDLVRQVALSLPRPDAAFLLHLDSDLAARRTKHRDDLDGFYDRAHLRAASDRFVEFARVNGWTRLDATADPAVLLREVLRVLDTTLTGKSHGSSASVPSDSPIGGVGQ